MHLLLFALLRNGYGECFWLAASSSARPKPTAQAGLSRARLPRALTWGSGVHDGEDVDGDGGGVEHGKRPEAVRDGVLLRGKEITGQVRIPGGVCRRLGQDDMQGCSGKAWPGVVCTPRPSAGLGCPSHMSAVSKGRHGDQQTHQKLRDHVGWWDTWEQGRAACEAAPRTQAQSRPPLQNPGSLLF